MSTDWKTEVVPLTRPIKVLVPDGDQMVEHMLREITVREPDVDALEVIQELGIEEGVDPTMKQSREMFATVSDVPSEVIGRLHPVDFMRLGEAAGPLLEAAGEIEDKTEEPPVEMETPKAPPVIKPVETTGKVENLPGLTPVASAEPRPLPALRQHGQSKAPKS